MLDDLVSGKASAYKHTPMVNLPAVLGISREEVDAAMGQMHQRRIRAAEDYAARLKYYNERTFRPHLWVVPIRKMPTGIVILGLAGGEGAVKHVPLPEVLVHADGTFDAEAIGAIMRAHYQENEGKIPYFGEISSYRLVRIYCDNGIEFSPEGVILTDTPPC